MLELIFLEGGLEGGSPGQTIRLTFEKAWFGAQTTCDFVLQGEGIDRVHFSIVRRDAGYALIDNKSASGTFLNGARVHETALHPGDDIIVGSNHIRVRQLEAGALLPFHFVAERTSGDGGLQIIEEETVLLGRKGEHTVQLNDPSVDALHAKLELRPDGVWITDESSGTGVYVNGQRVVEQRLRDRDVIIIRPFEITISLTEEMCLLSINDRTVESAGPVADLPENYKGLVSAPARPEVGQAKPSSAIAALPRWMQAKAPIWVPTSDILPNRVRSALLWIGLLCVVGGAAVAFAARWNTVYSPGPLSTVHADLGCESCHSSFARVGDVSCQACHADKVPVAIHAKNRVRCTDCHSEHRGATFDIARDVGNGCQSVGCHVTIHTAEKRIIAGQVPEPGVVVKAVALAAHFEAGDAMHAKHSNLLAACAACHTDGDATLLKTKPDQPGIRVKELRDIRMKCLACHGFGSEATLGARCYSCHLEHPTDKAEILTVVRFPDAPPPQPKLAQAAPRGLLVLLGALVGVPLFFVAAMAGGLRLNQRRLRAEVEERVRSAPAAPAPIGAAPAISETRPAELHPADNQAPGGNLRPRIDLDLCVGCGTCVHVCPFNVLEIVNEKAIAARLADCTGYAACVAECPTAAIEMVAGGAMQTVELPVYDANLESNVPGIYLAGEITGKALIKIAINQGKKAAESIRKNPASRAEYDVIVVGAGPAGTSAALAAKHQGLKVLVLEQGSHANTIRTYPRQKFVMAEPVTIPMYGPLWMEDTSKEALLERWQEIIAASGLQIQEQEQVLGVTRDADHFRVQTNKGAYQGAQVVLAVGKRGSPRKLGVPGEDSSKVAYNLLDADAYRGKALCIVGGGDSGIEAAYGLGRPDLEARVWLVHRTGDFSKAKSRNQKRIKKSMDEGRVTTFFNASVIEIRERSVLVKTPQGVEEIENDYIFVMAGGENPKKFLAECGIQFSERPLG